MARQLSLGIGGCLRKILLAGLAVAAIIACDRQKPGEEAGIIRIDIDGRSSGTGFVINQAGDVVTSFQVIAGAGNDPGKIAVIETAPDDGARHKVDRIEWSSAPLDLAVLHVAGLRQPAALLQEREPEPNDTVFAIGLGSLGASGESGDRLSGPVAREGTVRRVTADNRYRSPGAAAGGVQPPSGNTSSVRIIEHTAPDDPGSRGGPLVNACGEVVGIQAIGATVHVSVLIPELRQRNIGFTLASDPCNPLWPPVATYAAIGGAALLGLILLVLAFRRPRQRAAGTVGSDTTDRRSRGRAPNAGGRTAPPRPADPGRGWALSGFAHDGRAIHIAFQEDRITKAGRVLTIGRDPELCQIVLDDDTVSGCHARLQARPDPLAATFTFFVEDLGSTNGTAVDGKPVSRPFKAVPLPIGSTLRIGGCRMTFTRG